MTQARRARQPLAVLYLDVDDMQELNDLHGREVVDEALAELCERVCQTLDGRGPLGRVDGGSFAVLLVGCGADEAVHWAERIRGAVAESATPRLTVSVGVAVLRRDEAWGNLLEAAEGACRRAKQGGRNFVAAR